MEAREEQIRREKIEANQATREETQTRNEKLQKMKMARIAKMEAMGISKKHRAVILNERFLWNGFLLRNWRDSKSRRKEEF